MSKSVYIGQVSNSDINISYNPAYQCPLQVLEQITHAPLYAILSWDACQYKLNIQSPQQPKCERKACQGQSDIKQLRTLSRELESMSM